MIEFRAKMCNRHKVDEAKKRQIEVVYKRLVAQEVSSIMLTLCDACVTVITFLRCLTASLTVISSNGYSVMG